MAYTKEQKEKIFNTICERISKGEPLRNILDSEGIFNRNIWFELLKEKDKNEQYAHAHDLRADKIFEEIMQIADAYDEDVKTDKQGNEIINHHVVNRDRLRVDSRKWILSKMDPKKYGDKLEVEKNVKTTIIELPKDYDKTKEPKRASTTDL